MDIVVVGGGGTLGRLICSELEARGHSAIPLGRKSGDLRDPAVIAAPKASVIINCAGASVALGLGHGWRGYRAIDVPIGRAVAQAVRTTNARLIYVGVHHPPALRDTAYVDAHEQVAEAMRDVDGCVVRATGFYSSYAGLLPMARRGLLLDMGNGRARTNPICERDLAVIIADIALGNDGPRDVAVGGPEVMTRREIFEHVAAVAGRRVRVGGIPVWVGGAGAALMSMLHPRIGQFARFAVGLAKHDVIAPGLGTTRLGDYLREVSARERDAARAVA